MLVYRKSLVRIELFSYVKKFTLFQEIWDQFSFLGNSSPTLPLGENVGLGER